MVPVFLTAASRRRKRQLDLSPVEVAYAEKQSRMLLPFAIFAQRPTGHDGHPRHRRDEARHGEDLVQAPHKPAKRRYRLQGGGLVEPHATVRHAPAVLWRAGRLNMFYDAARHLRVGTSVPEGSTDPCCEMGAAGSGVRFEGVSPR